MEHKERGPGGAPDAVSAERQWAVIVAVLSHPHDLHDSTSRVAWAGTCLWTNRLCVSLSPALLSSLPLQLSSTLFTCLH